MTDLRDKHVLITGAASGLGRLMALRMADQGAKLILWDIDSQGLAQVANAISQCRVSVYTCDISKREAIQKTARTVLEQWGHVDVLINNAGVVSGAAILDLNDEAIERTFAINSHALLWTTRAFLPTMMERQSGHIVTMASAAGLVGNARMVDYSASKFAAVGFAESLRVELSHYKSPIRTTLVCPYYINTGMFDGVKTRYPWLLPILKPEDVVARIITSIQKNRRRLIMPWFVKIALPLKLLPPVVYDKILDWLGVSHTMDDFRGRTNNK